MFDIEAGRIKREGGKLDGKIIKDKKGNPFRRLECLNQWKV